MRSGAEHERFHVSSNGAGLFATLELRYCCRAQVGLPKLSYDDQTMGCGTSKSVDLILTTEKESAREWNTETAEIQESQLKKQILIETSDKIVPRRTWSCPADSENFRYEKSSLFIKPLVGNNTSIQSPPISRANNFVKTPGNMDLQERINILSQRRRSLQFEIGRESSGNDGCDANLKTISNGSSDFFIDKDKGSPNPPISEFTKRKSIFPPPPETNGYWSPFGQRPRITLTDSQNDFFRMLDEKIAQGKDYYSEDEQSISSLVSRTNGSGKLTKILASLRAQRTR